MGSRFLRVLLGMSSGFSSSLRPGDLLPDAHRLSRGFSVTATSLFSTGGKSWIYNQAQRSFSDTLLRSGALCGCRSWHVAQPLA